MAVSTDTIRFETGISENNLKHWGELHAVKELLQNSVFAKTILGDDISIKHDGEYAIIHNTPSGFSKGKLLIGESEQSDVAGAPGQYGEGMKVAMAVARRCGISCRVDTNGFTVIPELEPSSLDPDVKSLVFYISDNKNTDGTTFTIGCSKEVLEEAKTYFAVLQGLDIERTKKANIMEDFKGIYANGVKITETPALFGYNFTNTELINRDRSTVDMDKLRSDTRQLLSRIDDEATATKVLKSIMKDDGLLESQAGLQYPENRTVWQSAVRKLYGNKIALATGTDSDTKARYKKFTVITGVPRAWRFFFETGLGIRRSDELRETTVATNKHKKATPEENKNLGWAKRLIKMYYADYGKVKVSEELVDGFNNPCVGLYDHATDVIWLKRSILKDKEELFTTLLHEVIHKVTGASDNTEEFTRGWEKACWMILTRGKGE